MFKVNNKSPRMTPVTVFSSGVFVVKFEDISHLVLVFLLLTLKMYMPAGESKMSENGCFKGFIEQNNLNF